MKVPANLLFAEFLPNAKDKKKIMAANGVSMPPLLNSLDDDYFNRIQSVNPNPDPSTPSSAPWMMPNLDPVKQSTGPDTSGLASNLANHPIQPMSFYSPQEPVYFPHEKPNIGEGILGVESAIDALLPYDRIKRQQVVQPQQVYNPHPYGTGSQALCDGGEITPVAKDGKWIQKAINPSHKGYCTPMTKKTCTPRRKALAKTFKKHHGFHDQGGRIIPDGMSNFNPHDYEDGGNVNGGAKIREVGKDYPNSDLMEQWLLYQEGGNVNGGAKIKEVGADYPNSDLMEQWLLYENGGNTNGGAKIREVGPNYPNSDLLEQWLLYRDGGNITSDKAKEMLRDGTAQGHALTDKQKRYFGWIAGGRKAAEGMALGEGDKGGARGNLNNVPMANREGYYKSSAQLSYYKNILNDKLKAKNPEGFGNYFSGLRPLRQAGKQGDVDNYIQNSQYNDYLSPDEVKGTLGKEYDNYLNSLKTVNSYDVSQGRQPLYGQIEGENDPSKLNYGRRFASLQVTPSLDVSNITATGAVDSYHRQYSYDPAKGVTFNETGNAKLRPSYVSAPPTDRNMAGLHDGGMVYADGGMLQTHWGGNAEQVSDNPYDGGTMQFNGASHEDGGIGMTYNDKPVEVEGGETAVQDPQGNLNVFGNMYVPGTNKKFKTVSKEIADKEKRFSMLKTKGSELVNRSSPQNKYQLLGFNSGTVMMENGADGQKKLAQTKLDLAALQNAMLETAQEHNVDPHEMSKGKIKKAKNGTFMKAASGTEVEGDPNDPTRADRNNNPGNIKKGKFTKQYFKDIEMGEKYDKDGFAIFPSRQEGARAMKKLLTTGQDYRDTPIDKAIHTWTGKDPYRYQLPADMKNADGSAKKVSELSTDQVDNLMSLMSKGEGTRYGLAKATTPAPTRNTPATPFTPYGLPETPAFTPPTINPTPKAVNAPPLDEIQIPQRPVLPTNARPLGIDEVAGELYGAATNREVPVAIQKYNPQQFSPYQVSFQDRLNLNQDTFSAISKQVGANNPAALGSLAAQKYSADNAVKGDEFRTNQAISSDITNRNVSLENEAQLKNLQLADTHFTRQDKARSKTHEFNQMIVNSLASKYAQNKLENRRLTAYENLYDYRFVPTEDGGQQATYLGPDAQFNFDAAGNNQGGRNLPDGTRTTTRYNPNGTVKAYTEYSQSDLKNARDRLDVLKRQRKLPLLAAPPLQ